MARELEEPEDPEDAECGEHDDGVVEAALRVVALRRVDQRDDHQRRNRRQDVNDVEHASEQEKGFRRVHHVIGGGTRAGPEPPPPPAPDKTN